MRLRVQVSYLYILRFYSENKECYLIEFALNIFIKGVKLNLKNIVYLLFEVPLIKIEKIYTIF